MEENLSLDELRIEINKVDKDIVKLLEKRFNLVLAVGQYKKINSLPVHNEKRENDVINRCKELLNNDSFDDYLEKIYLEIIRTCKDIQKNEIKIL